MNRDPFNTGISRRIWDSKYRWREPDGAARDATVQDTWRRVARALASVEKDAAHWEQQFYSILEGFRFLPGGRILAGAGTGHRVTLFNCFVMGTIEDSLDSIFDSLKEGALTMQQGGGIGMDFSTLRPSGVPALSVGVTASGPVSFMHIWDAMCATILSTGARRGAMMATLRCDHPDIFDFVRAKRDPARLRHFNLSVLVTDDFMRAVQADAEWSLVFPLGASEAVEAAKTIDRVWSGGAPVRCRVYKTLRARELWDRIMRATYDVAEPGVLFIDRVNAQNNLWYAERIIASNPCGEIPLPAYGACDLGSLNLTQFIRAPFTAQAAVDFDALADAAAIAVRLLDNVSDVSGFPLAKQAAAARAVRRLGLGLTGLGDALIMLNQRYDTDAARAMASDIMRRITEVAYQASIDLAREKGAFEKLDRKKHLQGPFIRHLPESLRAGIAQHGIRNSHLTAIAPTGTISLLANNVSSGIEPVFAWEYRRRLRDAGGVFAEYAVRDYAHALYQEQRGHETPHTPVFITAADITPDAHLDMQAALQPWVDNAISKTVNVPVNTPFEAFRSIYENAYARGLKGCTTFRPNPVTGEVLVTEPAPAVHCCSVEREAD
jgi:ribonucleoside-diphosphate reductase alpha chain